MSAIDSAGRGIQSLSWRWDAHCCSACLSALAAVLVGVVYSSITEDLPSLAALPDLLDPPDGILRQPTRLYDRTGEHVLLTLENPGADGSQYLTLDSGEPNFLPASLISATIATQDPYFWKHAGYSLDGIRQNAHPTLAQQLVSNLLLWDETPGLRRALRERLLAAQITSHFGRQQILTWYLNSVNYGRLAFGADAAARVYFGKPASRAHLAEVGHAGSHRPGACPQPAGLWSRLLSKTSARCWIRCCSEERSMPNSTNRPTRKP